MLGEIFFVCKNKGEVVCYRDMRLSEATSEEKACFFGKACDKIIHRVR